MSQLLPNQALAEVLAQLNYVPTTGRDGYLTLPLPVVELLPLVEQLQHHSRIYLDTFFCLTGTDGGAATSQMHLHYHLKGMLTQSRLHLHLTLPRDQPEAPSLCPLYAAANWLERETYDLLGINFTHHPDLRRILLPADWPNHPLRQGEPEVANGIYSKN